MLTCANVQSSTKYIWKLDYMESQGMTTVIYLIQWQFVLRETLIL